MGPVAPVMPGAPVTGGAGVVVGVVGGTYTGMFRPGGQRVMPFASTVMFSISEVKNDAKC